MSPTLAKGLCFKRWVVLMAAAFFISGANPAPAKEKSKQTRFPKVSVSLGAWISTGQTDWNHDATALNSAVGNPTSELIYEDLDSQIIELEAELSLPRRFFLRTRFGYGLINDGRLIDDDFVSASGAAFFGANQSGAHRISRTFSDIDDENLWYLNLDVGYRLWVSADKRSSLQGFIGYQHWEEKLIARGLKQIECTSVGNFCSAPGTETNAGQKVITNQVRWDSLRVGLGGGHWFTKRFRVETDLAFIPYSNLLNQDIHHLRLDLQQDPSFEMEGTGIGFNLEIGLKYRLTRHLSFLAGYRFWSLKVNDGAIKIFNQIGGADQAKINDFDSERYGATAGLEFLF
ncbi:MAG: hypothetical protein ACE5ER_02670 [Nitrospinaceae bacterium]